MAPVLCVKADMEQVREEIQFSLRGCTAGRVGDTLRRYHDLHFELS